VARPAGHQHDPAFITAMREATISAVTTETATLPEPGRASAARTLKANLPGQTCLSPAEHHLLTDWLDRLAAEPDTGPPARHEAGQDEPADGLGQVGGGAGEDAGGPCR
jgi:hypothetical protein